MKRVYLLLTLFMTSFFFVSLNKVSAYTYEINESNFDYINEEFLKLREKTIEYCNTNELNYVIGYDLTNNKLLSYIFKYSSHGTENRFDMPRMEFYTSANTFYLEEGNLISYGTISSYLFEFYNNKDTTTFSYLAYLDTNIENLTNNNPYFSWIYTYKDLTYTINKNDRFPTLYEIYVDVYGEPEPPVVEKFTEEKELMNNFYSTIFTKISDLATSLANNYTFLIIFGIFILIFVLELIRRYLL